ncbi:5-deoxy-glucuronate isomerase [Streptosporangium sp. KLBMP 9127]|nr:5-deoxy-glucuronate isomerase [Streptosporangium sp. KLBMP 9127]
MNVYRKGELAAGPYELEVTPVTAGWGFSGLRVLELPAGGEHTFGTGEEELIVLPLRGGCVVTVDGERFEVTGRDGVFERVTDFVYAPRDAEVRIASAAGGRFALPSARAGRRLPARYGPAEAVPVEIRGSGTASRQVNNFAAADVFEADRLIAVEVITPGGNWSSYPPHKHDEERPGESRLEEIYYFEGNGFQRVYTSGPGREIDVCAEVGPGDVVLIPHGYHGPSMAPPGYDLYYLNVMAGPGERVWLACDDPRHAWVRDTWAGQAADPRLPLTTAQGRTS